MKRLLYLVLTGASLSHACAAIVMLTTQHVDLGIDFNASLVGTGTNPWLLTARDEDGRKEYAGERDGFMDPQRMLLQVAEQALTQVPDDDRYTAFLGPAGSEYWILPQSQDTSLLYLGSSTENKTTQTGWLGFGVSSAFLVRGVPLGTFKNNQVTLSLAGFNGPGNFFLYSVDAFGNPTVVFDSADGLTAADSRLYSPANHVHFNWAFSAPGDYEIELQASGVLSGTNQPTESDLTTYRFVVLPEPGMAWLLFAGMYPLLARRRLLRSALTKDRRNRPR